MRRLRAFVIVAVVAVLIGYIGGWLHASSVSAGRLTRVVAMRWGDGKYGPAFYGAHVYLVPIDTGFSVQARVYIGRGNSYFHDCGELGTVQTDAEAVANWGTIDWREDGLHIGSGTGAYFLSRAAIENHR
jgi:hypothetical protein